MTNSFASEACRCATGPRAASRWSGCCPRRSPWSARPAGGRIGMRHFDVQLVGGAAVHYRLDRRDANRRRQDAHRHAAAVSRRARRQGCPPGHGQRLPRRRDAEWMRPDLRAARPDRRRASRPRCRRGRAEQAYACDITYGTAKEFGFDFLRDRLLLRAAWARGKRDLFGADARRPAATPRTSPCSAGCTSCLVDEADSILIDEARTPLIIGARPATRHREDRGRRYRWAAEVAAAVRRRRALRIRPRGQDRSS